jgi:hypothetical protein
VALLLLVQALRAALKQNLVAVIKGHVPSCEEGAEWMRSHGAVLAAVCVYHGVADGAEVVLRLPRNEVAGLELETAALELPQSVYEHAEDVH